jgi:hypothetical protein
MPGLAGATCTWRLSSTSGGTRTPAGSNFTPHRSTRSRNCGADWGPACGGLHPLLGMTCDRFIQLRHDGVSNILGAADDRRHHPKIDHPGAKHFGHRPQPMPQRTRKLHLTHRTGVADVLYRRDLRGHRITGVGTEPLTLGQVTRPAHIQLRHRLPTAARSSTRPVSPHPSHR